MEPGARYATLDVDLTDNGVSLSTNKSRTWAPTRNFHLKLTVHEWETGAHCREHTGSNETCEVVVVDDDKWPTASAVERGQHAVYWQYVWQVRPFVLHGPIASARFYCVSHPIPSHPIPSHPIPSHPIPSLSHPIIDPAPIAPIPATGSSRRLSLYLQPTAHRRL